MNKYNNSTGNGRGSSGISSRGLPVRRVLSLSPCPRAAFRCTKSLLLVSDGLAHAAGST